ncbi:MAG: iron-containing alcohol dehydrogenase family protein [Opitutaceae bacterium]
MYHISSKISVESTIRILDQLKRWSPQRILLVSSPSVVRIPVVQELVVELKKAYSLDIHDSVKPDAPIESLDRLCSDSDKPDLIIAIGGGSVLDSSKALSVAWQGSTIRELFYKNKGIGDTKIPVLAVPSTAGSGAELSYGAILFDEAEKFKGGLRGPILQPDHVCIDLAVYRAAPVRLIAECGFDCLTHAIETYLSTKSTPMVRYQSTMAVQTVLAHLEKACKGDDHSLEQMALASALMGINLAMSSTCLPHRLQYVLGPFTETSHAQGLIMLYRGWLPLISKTDAFAALAKGLGAGQDELVKKIEALKKILDIDYRAGDFGLKETDINTLLEGVVGILDADPCYESAETLKQIMKGSL